MDTNNNEQVEVQNTESSTESVDNASESTIDNSNQNTESKEIDTDYSKNVAKRINKLTSKLSEKDAELAALKAQLENKHVEVPVVESKKPKFDDFSTIEEFTEALTDWKLEQKQNESKQRDAVNSKYKAYNELNTIY